MTVNEAALWLQGRDGYLILTHTRPDGDTMGSASALCSALRRAGKRAFLFPNPEVTEKIAPFVSPFFAGKDFAPAHVISVDIASPGLFPKEFQGSVELAVDHHPSNSGFAENTLLDASRAACGEIVLELIEKLCGGITKREADLLYIAISTDTGCFQYANVTENTYLSAARLAKAGADTAGLSRLFFRTFSRAHLALEGAIYSGLRIFHGGQIVAALVTLDMMRAVGATEDDTDDIASLAGKLAGHQVSVTIREYDNGTSRVSLRSGSRVNVSEIARRFGGGGHVMAAGCTINASPEEALALLLPPLEAELDKNQQAAPASE